MNEINAIEKKLRSKQFRNPQAYAIEVRRIFGKGYKDPLIKQN